MVRGRRRAAAVERSPAQQQTMLLGCSGADAALSLSLFLVVFVPSVSSSTSLSSSPLSGARADVAKKKRRDTANAS